MGNYVAYLNLKNIRVLGQDYVYTVIYFPFFFGGSCIVPHVVNTGEITVFNIICNFFVKKIRKKVTEKD